MKILGIDPGTSRIGYCLLETAPTPALLACGTISPRGDASTRLHALRRAISALIREWLPERAAVERLFFGKNRKTALRVAEARGVILETLAYHKLAVDEFTPREVKSLIAGDGSASKEGVSRMVRLTLDLDRLPKSDDAVDAVAIALCAAFTLRSNSLTRKQDRV